MDTRAAAGPRRRLADPPDPGAGDVLRDAQPRRLRAGALPDLAMARRRRREILRLPRLRRGRDEGGPGPRRARGGAEERPWRPDPGRVRRVARFAESILPGYTGPELYTRCCLYDMPPERDFVIDYVPGQSRIAVCIGAGHAAKFAGLLGRILSELAIDGGTAFPIEPFRAHSPRSRIRALPRYRLGASRRRPEARRPAAARGGSRASPRPRVSGTPRVAWRPG